MLIPFNFKVFESEAESALFEVRMFFEWEMCFDS